jgi:hypothetical protein
MEKTTASSGPIGSSMKSGLTQLMPLCGNRASGRALGSSADMRLGLGVVTMANRFGRNREHLFFHFPNEVGLLTGQHALIELKGPP